MDHPIARTFEFKRRLVAFQIGEALAFGHMVTRRNLDEDDVQFTNRGTH